MKTLYFYKKVFSCIIIENQLETIKNSKINDIDDQTNVFAQRKILGLYKKFSRIPLIFSYVNIVFSLRKQDPRIVFF